MQRMMSNQGKIDLLKDGGDQGFPFNFVLTTPHSCQVNSSIFLI